MYCIKCEVYICLHYGKNCYTPFHTEDVLKDKVIHMPKAKVIHMPQLPDNAQEQEIDDPETQSAQSDSDTDFSSSI